MEREPLVRAALFFNVYSAKKERNVSALSIKWIIYVCLKAECNVVDIECQALCAYVWLAVAGADHHNGMSWCCIGAVP